MEIRKFNRINNIVAVVVLAVASVTYLSTIEPTASFWDCGEFIASSYKLEVGHPPGNPVFQVIARAFTFFGDKMHAAILINSMSALCSAFTIFFLYLTIVHLVRRISEKKRKLVFANGSNAAGAAEGEFSLGEAIAMYAAGAVGALAYCWSDTFWFSAVEGEVYAMSSLFTAVVVWAMLKWEEEADEKYANRWIVLIAVLMGLSIGVQLLNLLTIPALVFVYYYKKYPVTKKGAFKVLLLSFVILAVVLWFIIPYTPKFAAYTDLLFVNGFGLPVNSGAAFFMVLVLTLCFWGVYRTYKTNKATWNTIWLCLGTMMIGYSVFAVVIIRSSVNTPTNEYQPDNPFTLVRYLNREQYGSQPILYGETYASTLKEIKVPHYYNIMHGKYVKLDAPAEPVYSSDTKMFFPRMYSSADPSYADFYNMYTNGNGRYVEGSDAKIPTMGANMKYFFDYQMNFMYWRYFFWNFVGRQNDLQARIPGDIYKGNWESGITFLDNARLGDQSEGPAYIVHSRAKNHFYFLPLILGLIGLWYQYKKDKRNFVVTLLLFFMTGIAIILYLNQTPYQPRERDYAYAGSFYAFAIWIGLGVAGLTETLQNKLKKQKFATAVAVAIVCLLVPIQVASQTWHDHDRSGRYTCRDFGQNYLMTLQQKGDPIIFTNGDNDTFPLWYNQETEGFRTDARTCNLSYLQTDWYIDQMKRPAYDSPSLPITWDRVEYVTGTNDYISIRPEIKNQIDALYAQADSSSNPESKIDVRKEFGDNPYELKNILKYWVRSDKEGLRVIPTDSIVVKIDKEAVKRSGMTIPEALGDSIPEYMHISLKDKRARYKSELMMLEMLAKANWERPIYMAITVGGENRLNMDNHFVQEGLAYRFTPFDAQALGATIDSEKMYDNLMNKFKFGGINKAGIYIDENTMRMCYTHRRIFTQLITQLLKEGKKDKALKALEYCEKMIPASNVPYDYQNSAQSMAEAYYLLGQKAKGDKIMDALANKSMEYLIWYLSMSNQQLTISGQEFMYHIYLLDEEIKIMEKYKSKQASHYAGKLEELYSMYASRTKAQQ